MKKVICLIISSLCFSGCATILLPENPNPRKPEKLPEALVSAVALGSKDALFTKSIDEDLDKNEEQWLVTTIDGLDLDFKYLKSTRNQNKKHGLILIYNILNDSRHIVSGFLADALLEKGFDCIIVQHEEFLSKEWTRPVIPEAGNPRQSYDEYNGHLAKSVKRIIRSWIPKQKRLSGRYGFVGTSLGGIHAVAAAAIFPDAILTITIMAGGGNLDLFKHSQENLVLINKDELLSKYAIKAAERYSDARIAYPWGLFHDISELKFKIIEMAKCVDTKKIKMIITTDDTSVPTYTQWKLHTALGKPEARLFPCGHYSIIFYYFEVKAQMTKWMVEAFSVK